MNKKLKIFIVDDHPVIQNGLELLLVREPDMSVCGCTATANDAIAQLQRLRPDIAIVDISLKGGVSGLELIKAIQKRYPRIAVLVLSMHDEKIYAERAIRAGARGYIQKDELINNLVAAIRKVAGGGIYLSDSMTSRMIDEIFGAQSKIISRSIEKLTNRELEVLQMIGKGYATRDIAQRLNLSNKTVDAHRLRIKAKLKIDSMAELIKYATEWCS